MELGGNNRHRESRLTAVSAGRLLYTLARAMLIDVWDMRLSEAQRELWLKMGDGAGEGGVSWRVSSLPEPPEGAIRHER